jgi:hypothetical protein
MEKVSHYDIEAIMDVENEFKQPPGCPAHIHGAVQAVAVMPPVGRPAPVNPANSGVVESFTTAEEDSSAAKPPPGCPAHAHKPEMAPNRPPLGSPAHVNEPEVVHAKPPPGCPAHAHKAAPKAAEKAPSGCLAVAYADSSAKPPAGCPAHAHGASKEQEPLTTPVTLRTYYRFLSQGHAWLLPIFAVLYVVV